MMTSQVIRRLEGRGLVERKVDPEDSRAKLVIVTPLGVSLVPRAVRSVEEVDSSYFPDPTSALVGELQRIARAKEL